MLSVAVEESLRRLRGDDVPEQTPTEAILELREHLERRDAAREEKWDERIRHIEERQVKVATEVEHLKARFRENGLVTKSKCQIIDSGRGREIEVIRDRVKGIEIDQDKTKVRTIGALAAALLACLGAILAFVFGGRQ